MALLALFMATALAGPASAATRLNDVQWGDACGSRTFYSTVSANATMDGSSKVDLADLAFGGRVNLPSGCAGATKLCIDASMQQTASGTIATTTPFGAVGASFASAGSPVVSGKTASQAFASCWNINTRAFSVAVHVPLENAYIYTGGRYKLSSYTLKSRVRIVVGGVSYASPWATASAKP